MATYKAPEKDINFALQAVLDVGRLSALPAFAEATPDLLEGAISEAAKLMEEKIAPTNAPADRQGCRLEDGRVTVPDGLADAYAAYWQNGWVSLAADPEYDGQGLPYVLSKAVEEMLCSANVAFALYPGLTQGAFEGIEANGSDELKRTYLPRLATGEWTGTMCMTEPQAGSDVGAVRTKATPRDDGSYAIEGGKIFITSGEHDMADNIVHFVLARLPDAPEGVRGLSTFVVPKFIPDENGAPGERNPVVCEAIEEKMGIHGSCTCSLRFDGATGWIVGEPNRGIQNMFVMMNKARIMVGMQGLGLCELATQNAIAYARERVQGRPLTGGDNVAIIEHPDVRRMLFTMKAVTEGARVMALETALAEDLANHHEDDQVRERAQNRVDLGVPLVKAYCTDSAVELGSLAIQVYGGHGYIAEHGIEQIARDAKILCLYEGTNGIQAMDLVRRKLKLKNGALVAEFFADVRAVLAESGDNLQFIAQPLAQALDRLEATTQWLQGQLDDAPDTAGAGAAAYLRAFALTWLGYNWLRMAAAAGAGDDEFARDKRATAGFFATRLLPEVHSLCAGIEQPADDWLRLSAAAV